MTSSWAHPFLYWILRRSTAGRCMPLGEQHFDWLVQLTLEETLELLCWLGVLLRAKLFGLRICFAEIRWHLGALNIPVTAPRGEPYRGPERLDTPAASVPPPTLPAIPRLPRESTATGSSGTRGLRRRRSPSWDSDSDL